VHPGAVLNFDKMGEKLDGKYRVEKVQHAFGRHGYLVNFRAVRISKKSAGAAQKERAAKAAGQDQPAKKKEPVAPPARLGAVANAVPPAHVENTAEIRPPPGLASESELSSPPHVDVSAEHRT